MTVKKPEKREIYQNIIVPYIPELERFKPGLRIVNTGLNFKFVRVSGCGFK